MKLKKSKLLSILSLTSVASVSLLAISCGNTEATTKQSGTEIQSEQKVKYVALGDSISAGYNFNLGGIETAGTLKVDGVTGLSYPAFIVDYINSLETNRVESFNNFSLSGSTTTDWMYLLGLKPTDYTAANLAKFEGLKQLDSATNNPFGKRISSLYGEETGISENNANLIAAITSANLLTISLGANDVMKNLGDFFAPALKKLVDSSLNISEDIKNVKKIMTDRSKTMTANLSAIVKKIKSLNKTVNINLVSYPMPLLRIANFADGALGDSAYIKDLLSILNNAIKESAKETETNYVDSFDADSWNKSAADFTNSLYDIHPTELGYKKMAEDLVLKMTLGANSSAITSWNEKFVEKDKGYFKKQILFANKTPEQIFSSLEAKTTSTLLNKEVINEIKTKAKLSDKLPPLADFIIKTLQNEDNLNNLFQLFAGKVLSSDTVKFLSKKDAANKTNLSKLFIPLVQTDLLKEGLLTLEANWNWNPKHKFTANSLISSLLSPVLKLENLFKFAQSLFTNEIIQNNKPQSVKMLKELAQAIIQKSSSAVENVPAELAIKLSNNAELLSLLDTLFTKLIDGANTYFAAGSTFQKAMSAFVSAHGDELQAKVLAVIKTEDFKNLAKASIASILKFDSNSPSTSMNDFLEKILSNTESLNKLLSSVTDLLKTESNWPSKSFDFAYFTEKILPILTKWEGFQEIITLLPNLLPAFKK